MGDGADLAVVGAGPMGLAIAWRAAREGARVTVLDDGAPAAGHVAAGMLGPWSEAEHRDGPMHRLMVDAARAWPAFGDELAADSGQEVGYAATGTLLVAGRPEQIGPLRRHGETIAGLGARPEWRTGGELRSLEPGLGPDVAGGFVMDEEHQVDPRRAMAAMRAALRRLGGRLLEASAHALLEDPDGVSGVRTADGETLRAGHVVLAAGWRTGALAPGVPLRPVKGQILRLRAHDGVPAPATRVLRSERVYVAPRPSGEVVVGGTVEEASDTSVTAGAVADLLAEARRLLPDLSELDFAEAAAGLRPATPDGLPAIGRDRRAGLLWATGAFRHGILLCPAVAREIVSLSAGEAPLEHLAPFAPDRFETPA